MDADDEGDGPAELAEVMGALAAGDPAAVATLIGRYRPQLAAAVRRAAEARGTRLGPDEVDELVVDAALALVPVAGSWSPEGGAAPWTWAHHHIGRVVDRHLGQYADPLDPAAHAAVAEGPAAPTIEPPVLELAAALAEHHAGMALLLEVLEQVATPRDRALFLETVLQASLGDRSPAATVGRELGMAPAAVRQQHRRVRLRLQHAVATDPRYAALSGLPLVA